MLFPLLFCFVFVFAHVCDYVSYEQSSKFCSEGLLKNTLSVLEAIFWSCSSFHCQEILSDSYLRERNLGGVEHCSAPSRRVPRVLACPFLPCDRAPCEQGIVPWEPQGDGDAQQGEGTDDRSIYRNQFCFYLQSKNGTKSTIPFIVSSTRIKSKFSKVSTRLVPWKLQNIAREIKEDLNKGRNSPFSWLGRFSIDKM